MEKAYLNIIELSEYLNLKPSTVYLKVATGDLPHYRIGRLIRFRKEEIDTWMEHHKNDRIDLKIKSKMNSRSITRPNVVVDGIVKKAIEGIKGKGYTPNYGRPDRVKGLGEEVEDGTV